MWPIENDKLYELVKPQNTLQINPYLLIYSKKRKLTTETLLQMKLQYNNLKLKIEMSCNDHRHFLNSLRVHSLVKSCNHVVRNQEGNHQRSQEIVTLANRATT